MASKNANLKAEKLTARLSTPDVPVAQLTPGFFDSIFSEGMNPFDECFLSNSAPHHTSSAQTPSKLRGEFKHRVENTASEHHHTHTYAHINADLEHLRMKQTTPLSPPLSPRAAHIQHELPSSRAARSRSPSPYAFDGTFTQSPRLSISPITSPEDLSDNGVKLVDGLHYPKNSSSTSSNQHTPVSKDETLTAIFRDFNHVPSIQQRPANIQTQATTDSHNRKFSLSQAMATAQLDSPTTYKFSDPDAQEPQPKSARGRKRKSVHAALPPSPKIKPEVDASFSASFIPINPLQPSKKRKDSVSIIRQNRSVSLDSLDEDEEDLDEGGPDGEGKRARFLERNRIAASKCRKKKKLMNARLEERSRILNTENRYLNVEKEQLKADICKLKQIILMHHDCKCDSIQKYLKQEAGRFVEFNADLSDSIVCNHNSVAMDTKWSGTPQLKDEQSVFGREFNSFEDLEDAVLLRAEDDGMNANDDDFAMMFDHMDQ